MSLEGGREGPIILMTPQYLYNNESRITSSCTDIHLMVDGMLSRLIHVCLLVVITRQIHAQ